MKVYKSLLIAILLFVSCKSRTTNDESLAKDSDTTKTSESVDVSQVKPISPTEDFSVFWQRFRVAVLNSDTTQIISMTLFPFKARGTFDDDPIIKYNRQRFIPMFQAFLKQGSGLGETTELDEIKKGTKPKPTDVNGNYARISDLAFDKTDQGWKFSFAYLDYAIIDSLKK
jgi:hypothetical protein